MCDSAHGDHDRSTAQLEAARASQAPRMLQASKQQPARPAGCCRLRTTWATRDARSDSAAFTNKGQSRRCLGLGWECCFRTPGGTAGQDAQPDEFREFSTCRRALLLDAYTGHAVLVAASVEHG
jgi:hypothetical protein